MSQKKSEAIELQNWFFSCPLKFVFHKYLQGITKSFDCLVGFWYMKHASFLSWSTQTYFLILFRELDDDILYLNRISKWWWNWAGVLQLVWVLNCSFLMMCSEWNSWWTLQGWMVLSYLFAFRLPVYIQWFPSPIVQICSKHGFFILLTVSQYSEHIWGTFH